MPFTLSHPAAVAGLRWTRLPVAAMVVGSTVPDLPIFLRSEDGYGVTHSLPGIVAVDVPLGLLGMAAWLLALRDPLVDSAPAMVRDRLAAHSSYDRRQWLLAVPAVLLGALTHVGWDELTHQGRWGARHVAWLRHAHLGLPGYSWAQAVSGVVGGVVVAGWAARALLARPRRVRAPRVPSLAGRGPWLVVAVGAAAAAWGWLALADQGMHAAAFAAVVRGVAAGVLGLLAVAAAWWVLARRAPAG